MQIFKPYILDFLDSNQFWKKSEDFIIDHIVDYIGEYGSCRIALSGDEDNMPLYSQISNNSVIDWSKIELFQTDEKYIKTTHQDSNQKRILETFDPGILTQIKEINFLKLIWNTINA
jgi:6-phosphogluconolactonase/glucosamine-6-phosphate isomerase/deaminase